MKKIFCLDIETVPIAEHRGVRPIGMDVPSCYQIDDYWMQRERERMERDPQDRWFRECQEGLDEFERWKSDARYRGIAPLQETGAIPACHPTTAHVISVSTAIHDSKNVKIDTIQIDDYMPKVGEGEDEHVPGLEIPPDGVIQSAERNVLKLANERLEWAVKNGLTIVTFNGKGFDLPMMRWRSLLVSTPPPKLNWYEMLYPYRHKEHIDLRLLFSDGNKMAKGTLEMWCKAFGITAEESGDKVLGWAQRGEWDEIRRYGVVEMTSLIDLFRAVEGAL